MDTGHSPGPARYLNALPPAGGRRALLGCCGSVRWVEAMLAARPFRDDAALFAEAERAWWALDERDWREAFAQHPRIGERGDARSDAEQAGMREAAEAERRAIAEGNRAYERRFGHVFLICAAGRSAPELAEELKRRLANEPAAELRIAAREQARITRLRLEKLVGS